MWLITAEEGHKDDLLVNHMAVATSVEEVWQFAKTHLEGKPTNSFLEPGSVWAAFVPMADKYPDEGPDRTVLRSFSVAVEQDGKWVLHER